MRYFRLKITVSLVIIVTASVYSTWWWVIGRIPAAILVALFGLVAVACLLRLIGNLINTMTQFAKAVDSGETGYRLPCYDDKELNVMAESMNHVMNRYGESMRALETRKLYYDRILRIVTHEIRNAVTPVISLSKDIEDHPSRYSKETLTEAVGIIHSQTLGIKHFLDSYYQLTHLPPPTKETIDLKLFFSEIKGISKSLCEEAGLPADIVSFTIPVGLTVNGDRNLIRQVVVNLIKNGLEAVVGIDSPRVHIISSVSDDWVYISVGDNGIGLEPEKSGMLFQPFYTTKPGGSGIGLCLSRQIARLHNGDITVSTSPETTFTLLLPK